MGRYLPFHLLPDHLHHEYEQVISLSSLDGMSAEAIIGEDKQNQDVVVGRKKRQVQT